MKKLCLLLLLLGSATHLLAQKLEVAGLLVGGASRFGGASATTASWINVSDVSGVSNYTNNPFGHKYGFAYGAGAQAQLVARHGFLLGAQVTLEQLRSRTALVHVSSFGANQSAAGHTTLQVNAVNLQPYLGWRINLPALDLDLSLGTDIGFVGKPAEEGRAETDTGETFTISLERPQPNKADVRPRIGITAYRNHLGLSLSYAHGLTNYTATMVGANSEVYLRVLRLGLFYRM